MKFSLSWYLCGFAAASIIFTDNWWWALLSVLALVLDVLADVFGRTKLGQALARRRSE